MEKGLVSSAFDDIADLVPGKERVRIKARIVQLWKVPAFLNPNESGSIKLVLVDHKGGKIHASVRKQLIHVFESRLEEGRVYEFSDFSVFPQSGSYRTTLHRYKIGFQLKTVVVAAEGDDISQFGIKVTSLAEIVARTDDYEYSLNVFTCSYCPVSLCIQSSSQGAKIHATIRKQLIHMFESKLEEGHVYEMSIFSVFSQSGNYRTTLHPYKLVFHLRTKVTVVESPDISQFGMHFTSLAEIGAFTQDGMFVLEED